MADGYIGGIYVPDTDVIIPVIDHAFTFQVSESVPAGMPVTSISSALVSIASLDVQTGHVFGMVIEQKEHAAWPSSDPFIPSTWNSKGQFNLDWDVGNDNSKTAIVGGIQALCSGYGSSKTGKYHDFRVGFVNADNVMAVLEGDTTEVAGAAVNNAGTVTFTRTSGTWTANEWEGRVATFRKTDNTVVAKRVVLQNDTTTLTVKDDGISGESPTWTDVGEVIFEEDYWIYDIGSSGNGQQFNGINDFTEFAEVLNLEVYISGSWGDSGGNLTGNQARLRWDNMYNHADIASHPHADGNTYNTTQDMWATISAYVIYMFKLNSDGVMGNVAEYPDPDEDEGEWYLVDEIEAPHIAAGTLAKIESVVECPQGATIAFWVGAKTEATQSDSQKNKKGRPPKVS